MCILKRTRKGQECRVQALISCVWAAAGQKPQHDGVYACVRTLAINLSSLQ